MKDDLVSRFRTTRSPSDRDRSVKTAYGTATAQHACVCLCCAAGRGHECRTNCHAAPRAGSATSTAAGSGPACPRSAARRREKQIGGSGGSLEPPGPLLEPPGPLLTHRHTVYIAYSECLPTRLSPLAERTCFSQARRPATRAGARCRATAVPSRRRAPAAGAAAIYMYLHAIYIGTVGIYVCK